MADHDSSYKQFFSHPIMVQDLITGFIQAPWVEHINFATLERMSGSYTTDDLREREADVIWRVRWGEAWFFVYILLEFQSMVDDMMAVRVNSYLMLLYQDLVRTKMVAEQKILPPVLPIVLYNGARRWSAPLDVAEMITPVPPGMEAFVPRLRHVLVDVGRLQDSQLAIHRNLAAALFHLEQCKSAAEVRQVVHSLILWLSAPQHTSLRQTFVIWLKRVLLRKRAPGVTIPEVNDLQEVYTMLDETEIDWSARWKTEGLQLGMHEGGTVILKLVLEKRFGPLPQWAGSMLARADFDTLKIWTERATDGQSLEEILARVPASKAH